MRLSSKAVIDEVNRRSRALPDDSRYWQNGGALGLITLTIEVICEELNRQFKSAIERADVQLLERAAVLLAEEVQKRGGA